MNYWAPCTGVALSNGVSHRHAQSTAEFNLLKSKLVRWMLISNNVAINNQKIRVGAVTVLAEDIDAENTSQCPAGAIDNLMSIDGYVRYTAVPLTESDIVENLEDTIAKIGNLSSCAIVCFDEVTFIITSVDAFVRIESMNNCLMDNQWLNKRVFAKLHNKSIIVHGCIEYLANGGLTLIKGESIDAFLGSSVKPLKKMFVVDGDRLTSEIYIRSHHQDIVHSERLSRQYYKKDSSKLWSFHSRSTYDAGFFPIRPLDSQNHASVTSTHIILQSFITVSVALLEDTSVILNKHIVTKSKRF